MRPDLGLNAIELDRIYRATRHRLLDEPAVPLTIDGLVIRRRLGTGSSGLVYAAYDPKQDREVALKLVRPTGDGVQAVARTRAAVLAEARALARLSHPAIVEVYGVGERSSGEVYLTMARVDGVTLDRWIEAEPRPLPVLTAMLAELAAGLACAHEAGVCHGDVKPANVVVDGGPRPYWIDFGSARGDHDHDHDHDCGRAGTPGYRAPEIEDGGKPSARGDQYAFFVMLLEVLGRGAPTREAAIASLPRFLRTLVVVGLAEDPDARHASMQAVADALVDAPKVGRRRELMAWAAMAGVGLAAAILRPGGGSESPCTHAPTPLDLPEGLAGRLDATALGDTMTTAMRQAIDAYEQAWTRVRTEVCDPEVDARVVDLRLACLARGRGELSAILAALGALDPEDEAALTHGLEAIAGVAAPDRCTDVAPSQLRPDPDPGRTAALAQARALRALGKYDEARPALESLLQRLETPGADAVLRAETMLELAMLETQGAPPGPTLVRLRAVIDLAHEAGAVDLEARAWVRLIHVAHTRLRDPKIGREALPDARASVELAGDARLSIWLQIQEALIAIEPGDSASGLAPSNTLLEDALAQARALEPPVPTLVATALNALAGVQWQAGRSSEAAALHEEALALRTAALGPAHPDVALSHMNLAMLAASSGDHGTALTHFDTVLEVAEQVVGLEDPGLCRVYLPRARTHLALGHTDAAITDLRLAATKADLAGYPSIAEQARTLLDQVLDQVRDRVGSDSTGKSGSIGGASPDSERAE